MHLIEYYYNNVLIHSWDLNNAKEYTFENILLKTDTSGAKVRLGDVAKVEIGSENYSVM